MSGKRDLDSSRGRPAFDEGYENDYTRHSERHTSGLSRSTSTSVDKAPRRRDMYYYEDDRSAREASRHGTKGQAPEDTHRGAQNAGISRSKSLGTSLRNAFGSRTQGGGPPRQTQPPPQQSSTPRRPQAKDWTG